MEVVEQKTRCDLCRRSSFDVLHGRDVRVVLCMSCSTRVGEIALTANYEWLSTVWKTGTPSGPATALQAAQMIDVLTAEELETHADLAYAYSEMGLLPDAFQEAALVLSKGAGTKASRMALDVLFGERVARAAAVDELRRRLFPS